MARALAFNGARKVYILGRRLLQPKSTLALFLFNAT